MGEDNGQGAGRARTDRPGQLRAECETLGDVEAWCAQMRAAGASGMSLAWAEVQGEVDSPNARVEGPLRLLAGWPAVGISNVHDALAARARAEQEGRAPKR